MAPLLAVVSDGLTKRFGDFTAVDDLDLTIPAGTVMSLLGPNGAGKTTTVRMLATLVPPTSGTAVVCGHDVVAEADAVRGLISLTGQFAALEDNLTARENLMLMARLRGYGKADAARITSYLVDRFDIGEFRDKLIKNVSGGQRRRVDLASSLVTQPQLLVLDEPTTGLDPRSRIELWDAIRALVAQGTDVLLTTQYLEEADQLAGHVVIVDKGTVIASGTPSDLKAQAGRDVIHVRVGRPDDLGPVAELLAPLGSEPPRVDRPDRLVTVPVDGGAARLGEAVRAITDAGIAIDDIGVRRPTLDEVFLALTGHVPADAAA